MLWAPVNLVADVEVGHRGLNLLDGALDVGLALGALGLHQLGDAIVLLRVQVAQTEVLKLPLNGADPQPIGERA